MPEIPDDVRPVLDAAGIKSPESSRWRHHRLAEAPFNRPVWATCRCTYVDLPIQLLPIEINERDIGIGQCSQCGVIHWCLWRPASVTTGNEWVVNPKQDAWKQVKPRGRG